MKKPVKIILWLLAIIFGGALLLILSTPLWLGPLSTSLANSLGPKYTGTKFNVAKIHINPLTGSLRVEDFHLGNPEGYDAEDAVSVGKLSVDIAPFALLGNRLHVKNIDVIDPYASYLGNDGTNNFDAIVANIKKNLGIEEKAETEEAKDEAAEKDEEKDGMKVTIDRLHIEGVKFKMGIMPAIPIPIPITLTDLGTKDEEGKDADGLTMKEMASVVSSKVSESFSKVGGGVMNLFGSGAKSVGDAASGLGDGAMKAAGVAGDAVKSVGSGAADAAGKATDVAKSVGSGAADAAGKAVDMAGDAAKSVGDGAKNLLKGAGSLFGGGDKK